MCGTGTGTFACRLARRGIDVVGLDPAAASFDVARGKAGAEKVRWVHSDACDHRDISVDRLQHSVQRSGRALAGGRSGAAQCECDETCWCKRSGFSCSDRCYPVGPGALRGKALAA